MNILTGCGYFLLYNTERCFKGGYIMSKFSLLMESAGIKLKAGKGEAMTASGGYSSESTYRAEVAGAQRNASSAGESYKIIDNLLRWE